MIQSLDRQHRVAGPHMTLIAMTSEFGSLSLDVAMSLGAERGLDVVHHDQVEHHVADKLAVSEDVVRRYFEGRVSIREQWSIDPAKFCRFNSEELLGLALRGNVIIRGLDAIALLRTVPHVLCVRICASMPTRIERAMMIWRLTDRTATLRAIENRDKAQARIAQGWLGKDWQDPALYHVSLNTDQLSIDSCVACLSSLTQDQRFVETEASRQTLADLLVATRIRIALERGIGPKHHIEVAVDKGDVVLTGSLGNEAAFRQAVGLARAVAGVGHVEYSISDDRRRKTDGRPVYW